MALTKKEKRQLVVLIERERAAGFLGGQEAALKAELEARAKELFRADLAAVLAVLSAAGIAGALTRVPSLDWAGRWALELDVWCIVSRPTGP